MGIPRNGCRTSKSLSPVIIQEAFAEMANSRNLLSLGSRQSNIFSDIVPNTKSSLNSFIIVSLVSKETYLSNLGRTSTSQNSLYVSTLPDILPNFLALSNLFCNSRQNFSPSLFRLASMKDTRAPNRVFFEVRLSFC